MWPVPGRAAVLGLAASLPVTSTLFVTLPQSDIHRTLVDGPSVAISEDGRLVAFTSFAQLVPADVDRCRSVYIFDRQATRVSLESEPQEYCEEDRDADHPRLSADGQLLVYQLRGHVFLRDRQA